VLSICSAVVFGYSQPTIFHQIYPLSLINILEMNIEILFNHSETLRIDLRGDESSLISNLKSKLDADNETALHSEIGRISRAVGNMIFTLWNLGECASIVPIMARIEVYSKELNDSWLSSPFSSDDQDSKSGMVYLNFNLIISKKLELYICRGSDSFIKALQNIPFFCNHDCQIHFGSISILKSTRPI
jgi:hypothetical protein